MQRINTVLVESLGSISSPNPARTQTSTLTSTNKCQKQPPQATSFTSAGNDKRIDTLFMRFTAIYGQLWLNAYQNERVMVVAKKEWSESLRRFDNQILKQALHQIKAQCHYPPSLPMFVDCCKALEARCYPVAEKEEPFQKCSPEIAEYYMQLIKSYLNKR